MTEYIICADVSPDERRAELREEYELSVAKQEDLITEATEGGGEIGEMTLFQFPDYAVSASAHSVRMYITNWLLRPGMLAESSAPQPGRMPILRQWLHWRDENQARKTPPVLGIEAHREDRQPVASG